MKLWQKNFSVHEKIIDFTVGKDQILDLYLAKYDVIASMAQADMLALVGLISQEDNQLLQKGLSELLEQAENGTFTIEKEFEDVHSKIEFYLTEKFGEAGKKVHTARSRNDQVLVAQLLFFKDYLQTVSKKVEQLFQQLLQQADTYKDVLIPGYTHFQAAMPSSFGLWFSAYAEHLISDVFFLEAAYQTCDQNPLGSGAGFGSSFPINRTYTTQKLGFSEMAVSSVGAQMLRGKSEKAVATAIAYLSATFTKMSYDLIMYNSQDLRFVDLPKELTTGSSIMPHKKNPDVFELIRAHCNRFQSLPNEITLIINNLPSGYHRDFQILKEVLFDNMMQFLNVLDILIFSIPQIIPIDGAIHQEKYDLIFTVENINKLIQEGKSFRDAYRIVGEQVENGTFKPLKEFKTSHEGSVHHLCLDEIKAKWQRMASNSKLFGHG